MKVHLRMLDFVKTFFHHFKDGLATLLSVNAFEIISNLVGTLVTSAWDLLNTGKGIPAKEKTTRSPTSTSRSSDPWWI